MKKYGFALMANLLFLLLFAALLAGSSCEKGKQHWEPKPLPKPASTPPADVDRIVFVLLDAARADRFHTYGNSRNTTPRMDEIGAKGAVFERHFSQSHATRNSMPQLMLSKYFSMGIIEPLESIPSMRLNYSFIKRDPTEILLPTLMNKNGFKTVCFSAHTGINDKTALGKSFGKLYNLTDEDEIYPYADKVVNEVQRWIIENRDRKFFVYVHLMDTHFPHYEKETHKEFFDPAYDWRQDFRKNGKPKLSRKHPWSERFFMEGKDDPRIRRHLKDVYDGDLKFADIWVGKLYDTIVDLGIDNRTLFIITADHGEELGEHGWYTHVGVGPWDTSYHIPMIMVWPGRIPANERVTSFTQHIDVVPTLVDLYGLSVPDGKTFDGESLAGLIEKPTSSVRDFACGAWDDNRYIRTDKWSAGWFDDGKYHLYDVEEDPEGQNNLAAEKPELVKGLLGEVEKELGKEYAGFMSLPYGEPTGKFLIPLKRMFDYIPIPDKGLAGLPDVAPGKWIRKGKYFIGRGGPDAESLVLESETAPARYTVDFDSVHNFGHLEGRGSVFMAAVGDGPMRKYSTAQALKSSDEKGDAEKNNKRGWKKLYVPLGIVDARGGRIKIRLSPTDNPDEWVVIRAVRMTPVGAKDGELSESERKRLKALGYVE